MEPNGITFPKIPYAPAWLGIQLTGRIREKSLGCRQTGCSGGCINHRIIQTGAWRKHLYNSIQDCFELHDFAFRYSARLFGENRRGGDIVRGKFQAVSVSLEAL